MAFNQRMAFEVDAATGNDANGGGFDDTTGTPGTNRAWGANQLATAVSDVTTAGAGSTFTSATLSALSGGAAGCVGNVVNLTSGTNITTGRYQILSQAAGTFTVDRALSTGASSNGTGTMGGALLTIQAGINAFYISAGAVAGGRCYVKKGNYTGTVALVTAGSVAASRDNSRLIGYQTTHGDNPMPSSGNQPSYAVGSGAGVNGITMSTAGLHLECIEFDGTATSGSKGLKGASVTSTVNGAIACKFKNFTNEGWDSSGADFVNVTLCEVTGCGGTTAALAVNNKSPIMFNWSHLNTKSGILLNGGGSPAIGNLCTNNSGASSDGITVVGIPSGVMGNTIYGNGRDGIRMAISVDIIMAGPVMNNILAKNVGSGINQTSSAATPLSASLIADYNAFYGNGTNYTNAVAGTHDVAIAINPFNSSDVNLAAETSPDWGLNNTASAGASLRAAGFPGNMPGLTTSTGYRDIGLFQHQDSGGGSGAVLSRVFTGY